MATASSPAPVTAELPLDAEEYLTWLAVERGRSRNTLKAYRHDLSAYVAWLEARSVPLEDVTEADVAAYVGHLRADGRAPASVARALAAVRNLHRFLAEEGRTANDPAVEVAAPRVPSGLPKPLSEEDVTALLDTVVGNDVWLGYRAMVMPGVHIGHGAIIASGAVVVDDVPDYGIVGGNPARLLRRRYSDADIDRLLAVAWWDWPFERITVHVRTIMSGSIDELERCA